MTPEGTGPVERSRTFPHRISTANTEVSLMSRASHSEEDSVDLMDCNADQIRHGSAMQRFSVIVYRRGDERDISFEGFKRTQRRVDSFSGRIAPFEGINFR